MRQPLEMMGNGWVPHVVEGIYDNNDQEWPRSVEKSIEAKELNQVRAVMAFFDQARVLPSGQWYEWVDSRKNRRSWGQCAHQCKELVAETTVDGGKQAINTNVVALCTIE